MKTNIQFPVTEDQQRSIRETAHKATTTASDHDKNCAMNSSVELLDLDCISEHTLQLSKIRNAINIIADAIETQGTYTQQDIDTVVALLQSAVASEKELLEQVSKKLPKPSQR